MANLLLCGFEWGTHREAGGWRYSVSEDSIKVDYVRSGKYSCKVSVYDHILFPVPAAGYTGLAEFYLQFAVRFDPLLGLGGAFFSWEGSQGGKRLGYLTVGSNGQVLLYTGNSGSTDAITYPTCGDQLRIASRTRLITEVWYVFELYIKTDPSAGTITMKIDGNLEGSFYGDTGNSNPPGAPLYYSPDTIDFYCFNGMWLDDIVIDDSDWPGCQKIVLLRPNAEGDVIEWSRTNDYDNYEHVNDIPPDTVDYVYSTSTEKTDIYKTESLPEDAFEIATLRSEAWAVKNSASISQNACIAFALKNGVTTTSPIYASTTVDLSLTWQLVSYAWGIENPDTEYYWTTDDVNNLQSGVISK